MKNIFLSLSMAFFLVIAAISVPLEAKTVTFHFKEQYAGVGAWYDTYKPALYLVVGDYNGHYVSYDPKYLIGDKYEFTVKFTIPDADWATAGTRSCNWYYLYMYPSAGNGIRLGGGPVNKTSAVIEHILLNPRTKY